jgi:hypothetical protein
VKVVDRKFPFDMALYILSCYIDLEESVKVWLGHACLPRGIADGLERMLDLETSSNPSET